MKKAMLIVLVVLVLIGGGAAAYLVKHNKDKKAKTTTTSSKSTNKTNANNFSPVSTAGLAYEATITSEVSGNSTTASIKSDGKGTTQYSATTNGQKTEITYTADAYYLCSGTSQCIKYPASQSGQSGFDPSAYAYTNAQLTGYRSGATYKGKQSCPSGTCDTWSVSAGGATSTLFIDSGTKRITEAETTTKGSTSKVVYDYKAVSITVPANAMTLPTSTPTTTPSYP